MYVINICSYLLYRLFNLSRGKDCVYHINHHISFFANSYVNIYIYTCDMRPLFLMRDHFTPHGPVPRRLEAKAVLHVTRVGERAIQTI